MNTPQSQSQNQSQSLLDGICRKGVLVATSVRYWRGCKRLNPEDLGLDPAHVSDRLIQLGHKRLVPRDALQAFALIESRVQATVESSSFPFLGGIGRFVPNPRLNDLNDKLGKLEKEFRDATLDFAVGYGPLRDSALAEWREAARHLNGNAEHLIATIEQSFPPSGEIVKRFAFDVRMFQIAAPENIRLEVAEGMAEIEVADDRRRIAEDASRRLLADLDGLGLPAEFVRHATGTLEMPCRGGGASGRGCAQRRDCGHHCQSCNPLLDYRFHTISFRVVAAGRPSITHRGFSGWNASTFMKNVVAEKLLWRLAHMGKRKLEPRALGGIAPTRKAVDQDTTKAVLPYLPPESTKIVWFRKIFRRTAGDLGNRLAGRGGIPQHVHRHTENRAAIPEAIGHVSIMLIEDIIE